MTTFSEHAVKELKAQYNKHDDRIGSELYKINPAKYKALGLTGTDCITYVIECLKAGFNGVGDPVAAKKVGTLGKYGTELAKYLVTRKKWAGVYITPDEFHPVDQQQEHTQSTHLAKKFCYYSQTKIPMKYKVTNYTPTAKTHEAYQKLFSYIGEQKPDLINYNILKKVKFGYGVSRGGKHTWLFSEGKVYEVHWDRRAGDELYEATPLRSFGWLSGAIMVPPDQISKIRNLSGLSCN